MPFTNVNGTELYYEQQGSGEPLVLVHGLGTGSADWQFQFKAFAQAYQVIAPCLRGFGRSPRVQGEYSIPLFADDLAALLDQLQIERCHLCGVSMGGAVSFQFAVDHPQRVRSLVAINSQPTFELNTLKKKLLYNSRAWMARWLGLEQVSRVQLKRNFPGPGHAGLRDQLHGRFSNDPAIYLAALRALRDWTVVDRLPVIKAPVLVLASEFDYSTPEEKRQLVAGLPDARVVTVPGGHHAVHIEMPEFVNQAILEFLQSVDNASVAQVAPVNT